MERIESSGLRTAQADWVERQKPEHEHGLFDFWGEIERLVEANVDALEGALKVLRDDLLDRVAGVSMQCLEEIEELQVWMRLGWPTRVWRTLRRKRPRFNWWWVVEQEIDEAYAREQARNGG